MINNYCHSPFDARKIRYQLLTKDQKMHRVVLSSVHLHSASLELTRWKKRLVISTVSQRQGVLASFHHDCNSELTLIMWISSQVVCSSYDKYYDNLTEIYFSADWLVRADLQNRDTRVLSEVELGLGTLE